MDGSAIERIATLARQAATPNEIVIEGVPYTDKQLHDMRPTEPEPGTLGFSTLASFADYVRSSHDGTYRGSKSLFVHIESPTSVRLVTDVFGARNQRVVVMKATHGTPRFPFGDFMSQEDFVIAAQTLLVHSPVVDELLAIVGNMTDEEAAKSGDDGVRQEVTVRKGLRLGKDEINNPYRLAPYRTFPDLEQPELPFILRARGGGGSRPPMVALFEADAGKWVLEATALVKTWLTVNLPEGVSVFG